MITAYQPKCLVCQGSSIEPLNSTYHEDFAGLFEYLHCHSCDLLFIDPVPKDRLQEIYPDDYYKEEENKDGRKGVLRSFKSWLDSQFFERILNTLSAATISVLEVGGGTGARLDLIKAADSRVKWTQIVDFSKRAKVVAQRKRHNYFVGTIENYRPRKTFDLILLLNQIEHAADPLLVLKKTRELLKEKGIILVQTPNFDSFTSGLFRQFDWAGYHSPHNWVLFNKDSFTALVERAGLKVKDFRYIHDAHFWTASVMSNLAERGYIEITREKPAQAHALFPYLKAFFTIFDSIRSICFKTSQMVFVLEAQE